MQTFSLKNTIAERIQDFLKNYPPFNLLSNTDLFVRSKHVVNFIHPNKVYSLDEISKELKISVKDRHTAAGDAFITAIAFLKIISKLNKDGKMRFKDLFIKPMRY